MGIQKLEGAEIKSIASQLIDALMQTNDGKEWGSLSLNLTWDPKGEAPVLFMALLPGTSEANAKRIQDEFLSNGQRINNV